MGLKLNKPTTPKSVAELVSAKPITVNPLLTETQAATMLGLSNAYLVRDRWYAKKEGIAPKIPFIKLPSGGVRYHIDDLKAFIEANRVG
ncbi:helix-turn-helix transcriptional regulator [Phaeobacter marinintestinus]|uniref:helix-turn-helix transcriptional regulator n=1 Tax=Falsiphaeobacter marinintestinus TaxID=1492905 RepID=UPI0011B5CCF5|nr:helix-turn-helix domain-containing protein [Phaeobacter marinintestinus]